MVAFAFLGPTKNSQKSRPIWRDDFFFLEISTNLLNFVDLPAKKIAPSPLGHRSSCGTAEGAVPLVMAACAPQLGLLKLLFLEHHERQDNRQR